MNLMDEIVTSESGRRMLSYINNIYENDRYMLAKFQIAGLEIDELRKWVNELMDQISPATATWGLRYWEQMIGVPVNKSMSLEERRARILVWMTSEWPVTRNRMATVISEALYGLPVTIDDPVAPYTFRGNVIVDGDVEIDLSRAQRAIEQVKPAHLGYELSVRRQVPVTITTSSVTYEVKDRYCGTFICGQHPGGVY